MKNFWMTAFIASTLVAGTTAQGGTGVSASDNTLVPSGMIDGNAVASENAQTSNGSVYAQVDDKAQVSKNSDQKHDSDKANAAATLSGGTTLQIELTTELDAQAAKPGDEVTAKLSQDVISDGQVIIRTGSKLLGHVTEAKARGKEDPESRLGILFYHAVLRNGRGVTFNAMIQAVATVPIPASEGVISGGGPIGALETTHGGGPVGSTQGGGPVGVTQSEGSAPNLASEGGVSGGGPIGALETTQGGGPVGVTHGGGPVGITHTGEPVGSTVSVASRGPFSTTRRGVFGIPGVTLISGATQGSVISSASQNVKLDIGTQMLLTVSGSPQN